MTRLNIRWERIEDGFHHEEVWERGDDGVLYALFMAITALIHAACKMKEEKDEGEGAGEENRTVEV